MDNKFWQSTCKRSVDNLQQTCRQQVVASHANASWHRLVDNKSVAKSQQIWWNLRVSAVCITRVWATIAYYTFLWSVFFRFSLIIPSLSALYENRKINVFCHICSQCLLRVVTSPEPDVIILLGPVYMTPLGRDEMRGEITLMRWNKSRLMIQQVNITIFLRVDYIILGKQRMLKQQQ